jgi:hypothetical protein
VHEIAASLGVGKSAASARLAAARRAGIVDEFEGVVLNGGRLVRAVWYREKGAK